MTVQQRMYALIEDKFDYGNSDQIIQIDVNDGSVLELCYHNEFKKIILSKLNNDTFTYSLFNDEYITLDEVLDILGYTQYRFEITHICDEEPLLISDSYSSTPLKLCSLAQAKLTYDFGQQTNQVASIQ